MWASTGHEYQIMLKKLIVAALPAIATRYRRGLGLVVLGQMYDCDPKWLREQLIASGESLHRDGDPGPPLPYQPIPLPCRSAMP